MTAFAAFALLVAASLGSGAAILRLAGWGADRSGCERLGWSFALGFGAVGWLVFFLGVSGLLAPLPILVLLLACCPGLIWLGRPGLPEIPRGPVALALLGAAGLVGLSGLAQALAPATDGDTLAYHFALPKLFLAEGWLIFQPMAVDGAIPLLPQMTYAAAMALGGERAATLWCMLSGWGAALLVFGLCRRRLSFEWSLATALIWQTVPAVVYGAGSGQVDVRTAMFGVAMLAAAAEAAVAGGLGSALVAGLLGGFFMASKYPGMIFVGMGGLILLGLGKRRLATATVMGLAALAAGFQWYAWNWWNSGDPLFPLLFNWLPYPPGTPWTAAQAKYFWEVYRLAEMAVPQSLGWMLAYPLKASLDPLPLWEAGRTGLGPAPLLLAPFALAGAWIKRRDMKSGILWRMAVMVLGVYALWFLFGASQRVRHYLPLLPALLVLAVVAAEACLPRPGWGRKAVAAALAGTLALQLAGMGVFTLRYAQRLVRGESDETFRRAMVNGHDIAQWINANLQPGEKVMIGFRRFNALVDKPYFYGHFLYQAEVQLRMADTDPARFLAQLRAKGITHVIANEGRDAERPEPDSDATAWLSRRLVEEGCGQWQARITVPLSGSRTLGTAAAGGGWNADVLRLSPGPGCRL